MLVDKGTEPGIMTNMHSYLRMGQLDDDEDPLDTMMYDTFNSKPGKYFTSTKDCGGG